MRITILGGSNSGPRKGWSAAYAEMAGEHVVENQFLGAVGSLFGLLRLLKTLQDDAPRPDAVIFEYTLNDTLWVVGGVLTPQAVAETLHDVMTICAREGIRLLFLCLCLRPNDDSGETEGSLFLDQLYREAAQVRGAATLFLGDILGPIKPAFYVDPKHLDPASSRRVAEAVAARLRETPLPIPNGASNKLRFDYLDASQAAVSGKCARREVRSSVFDGPIVELERNGACVFETDGQLAALLVRSTERSGYYCIRAGDATLRKNAQSLSRDAIPNLIALHYVATPLPTSERITIEMTRSERAAMAAPVDSTLMEAPPLVPYGEQTLELAGIMVYKPRKWFGKAKARLFGG